MLHVRRYSKTLKDVSKYEINNGTNRIRMKIETVNKQKNIK